MRVVFMGTPEFAVPSLRALTARHEVIAVYTRPDAASGRGSTPRPSPVKQEANRLGLPVRQPASLRDPEEADWLRTADPDLIVVAAYGLLLPPEVLEIPRLGAVNVHASLLPRWRGAAPVQAAILSGDAVTGVSIMQMEEGLDTGPYCAAVEIPVADRSAEELTSLLADAGADALIGALPSVEAGTCAWRPQDEGAASHAPRISKSDVRLAPELGVDAALRRVRASSRQAPARVVIDGRGVRIVRARPDERHVPAGGLEEAEDGLLIGFSDGALLATAVKPEGRGEMDAAAWLCGARLPADARWEPAS